MAGVVFRQVSNTPRRWFDVQANRAKFLPSFVCLSPLSLFLSPTCLFLSWPLLFPSELSSETLDSTRCLIHVPAEVQQDDICPLLHRRVEELQWPANGDYEDIHVFSGSENLGGLFQRSSRAVP